MILKQEKQNIIRAVNTTKGITLVALVVTIVVLLILSGITIAALFSDNGIISAAQKAKTQTEEAVKNSEQNLKSLAEQMNEVLGVYSWKVSADGTQVIQEVNGNKVTLNIGDYINYDCTPVEGAKTSYTSTADKNGYADQTFTVADYQNTGYKWRIIGVDSKGQLELISEEIVPVTISTGEDNTFETWLGEGGSVRKSYLIQGKLGYINGLSELNTICDLYGHGKGATGGKLITIEEINKMTGLNGNNIDGNGTKYGKGQLHEYGNSVTYYWDGTDKPYYEASNGLKGNLTGSHNNGFTYYDESTKTFKTVAKPASVDGKQLITTIKSTYYDYSVPGTSMETLKPALYKSLFTNSSTGADQDNANDVTGMIYYIGSSAACTGTRSAGWGLGCVGDGSVYGGSYDFVYSNGGEDYGCCGVRPVVSLKSNIQFKQNGTRDGYALYNIEEK